jgi:hypothetical protein
MDKDRQTLYKEFIKSKIAQKLEEFRSKNEVFHNMKSDDTTYSQVQSLLLEMTQSKDFKKAMEGWKVEFNKKYPTKEMLESQQCLQNYQANENEKINNDIDINFGV